MKTASGYIMPHAPYIKEDNKIKHEYVEIAGIKWATMNIGAENITDTGLYFQWGDTQGYTAEQVGTDKIFNWTDYKYTDDDGSTMSKYNSVDHKSVLDASDDAVQATWGGNWRMPTVEEFMALGDAVNIAWTQVDGVSGMMLTDKTDSSKTLFFPACGRCVDSSTYDVGGQGYYWSRSLSGGYAYALFLVNTYAGWHNGYYRYSGFTIRGVLDE